MNFYIWDDSTFVVAETVEQARTLVRERLSVTVIQAKVQYTEPTISPCPAVYQVFRAESKP